MIAAPEGRYKICRGTGCSGPATVQPENFCIRNDIMMQTTLLAFVLFPAVAVAFAHAEQTGSWGDQGNGTYRNPILNADYPDVDIEKLGDKWYMITSTMHYAPGMTILESGDLVNWRIIGHMWDKLTWNKEMSPDRMGRYGFCVWAPDLAYHDGRWYCYFVDRHEGLFVSHAPKITGPWTDPKRMLRKGNRPWTDPAVFWDRDNKQAYLVVNWGRSKKWEGNQARVFRMSWDGLSLLDDGKPIYHGRGAEAAKIYKIDGEYYIFMAQWFGGDRKQIVLRGRSLYGPFRRKIIMEMNPLSDMQDRVRPVCQGALMQAPDGSWWLSHQLVQRRKDGKVVESYEGRSQWLVPIKWKDGWPTVPHDPDKNGVGNTVARWEKPIKGHPVTAPQTDDEFDSKTLAHQWQWNHNPRDKFWSLTERPGWLRLKAAVPIKDGGFWNAANTLSQRKMGMGTDVAVTRIDIGAMAPHQQGGLCHHSGRYFLCGVKVDADGAKRIYADLDGRRTQGPVVEADIVYFRTDIEQGLAWFSYGLDGEEWTRIGDKFEIAFGNWRGDRLGFYCWNDKKPAGHVDIDYFRYDYDGPKPAPRR